MGAVDGRYALISVLIEDESATAEEVASTLTGGRLCACFTRNLGGDQVDAIAKQMNIADRFIKSDYRSETISEAQSVDGTVEVKTEDGGD